MSAGELKEEIERSNEKIIREYKEKKIADRNYLKDALSDETKQQMEEFLKEDDD